MSLEGELSYYQRLGTIEENVPFSRPSRDKIFSDFSFLLGLLPPPPAKIIHFGCGTGWLSSLLDSCGYQVLGVDINEKAIKLAQERYGNRIEFSQKSFESIDYDNLFDAGIFYGSLHHCPNMKDAIKNAFNSIKSGPLIIYEPGIFHSRSKSSKNAINTFDVYEFECIPIKISMLGKKAGFKKVKIYPQMNHIHSSILCKRSIFKRAILSSFIRSAMIVFGKYFYGVTVLTK